MMPSICNLGVPATCHFGFKKHSYRIAITHIRRRTVCWVYGYTLNCTLIAVGVCLELSESRIAINVVPQYNNTHIAIGIAIGVCPIAVGFTRIAIGSVSDSHRCSDGSQCAQTSG